MNQQLIDPFLGIILTDRVIAKCLIA